METSQISGSSDASVRIVRRFLNAYQSERMIAMKKHLNKIVTTIITVTLICKATPISVFAGDISKSELIEQYAEYAYAESHAHIPTAKMPITSDSGAATEILKCPVIVPLNEDGSKVEHSTIEIEMKDKEDIFGIYVESDYRFYVFHNPRGYQFFRNCNYENGFYYILTENGTASIVGVDTGWYNAKGGGDIDIPAQIGGTVVTRIEDYAFSELGTCLSGVKDINMPDTVETIGIGAFLGVGGQQTKIHLSQNLKAIQTLAFYKAENAVIDEAGVIWLPDSLEFLGYRVFDQYYSAPIHGDNWGYLIRLPQTPVYMDSKSYRKWAFGKDWAGRGNTTLADVSEQYFAYSAGNPYKLFTPDEWACIEADPASYQSDMDAADKMSVLYQRIVESGKYELSSQYLTSDYLYNLNGGFLYDRMNIVTSD
jgi:hypothetical protein